MRTRFRASSTENVGVPIKEETGIDITTDAVEMAFTVADEQPTEWRPGEWARVRGQNWAVALIGPDSPLGALPAGKYWVSVRITDNPEIPVLTAPNQITIY